MVNKLPKEILNLANFFETLPNIGPKLAKRLAIFFSVNNLNKIEQLENLLNKVKENISTCEICKNLSSGNLCDICLDARRDKYKILVVEDSIDLYNIESGGEYHGVYHVLDGIISPVNGISPEDINITELLRRLEKFDESNIEIIFGLNPNLEGDATSIFIKERILGYVKGKNVVFTKLANGIPIGSEIEFLTGQTLQNSLKSRIKF